ncbi:MAG: hypothetical protein AB4352_04710 [Hormoscilla sp.]
MDVQMKSSQLRLKIAESQEIIYGFFIEIVKQQPPEKVLAEFKQLFIHEGDRAKQTKAQQALDNIILANIESEFINTIKRCCYILVNNWEESRQHETIQGLVEIFTAPIIEQYSYSPTIKRLRSWLKAFINGKEYQDLKLFCAKYGQLDDRSKDWSQRYAAYLLVPQYVNFNNSVEQRNAARARSLELKEQFKFDLAMYTARSESRKDSPKNPTTLGNGVLRLIKIILSKRGRHSYNNLADFFIQKTQGISYKEFKQSLQEYLAFELDNPVFVERMKANLSPKLAKLYHDYHEQILTKALLLRTCNRVIEYLTTENRRSPSSLFIILLSQGNSLHLVIVIMKIILICKPARVHLEAKIADLLNCYQDYPESECQWVINFMEVLNIALTISADNVKYNLIEMNNANRADLSLADLDNYRVFSQSNEVRKREYFPEVIA